MSDPSFILQTRNLTFGFSPKARLFEQLNLQIPPGVFGLLGPNGAGKSTLLKVLLGLARPLQGEVSVFGQPLTATSFHRIGALIEEPQLYPHLSGWEHLQVMAIYRQIPKKRIPEVLEMVGLIEHARRRIRHYSTGMKQRLGMAVALLPDPDLLIFDEPTNGLDPQGIVDTRHLLQTLHSDFGKNIIVSSHLLSEIEQICTHVAIFREGRLLFQGAVETLHASFGGRLQITMEVADAVAAIAALSNNGKTATLLAPSEITVAIDHKTEIPALIDALRKQGIPIFQIWLNERTLEDYFLQIINQN